MKLYLGCPQCGEKDWNEITNSQTGESIFQCQHCKTEAQPEEMIAYVEKEDSSTLVKNN